MLNIKTKINSNNIEIIQNKLSKNTKHCDFQQKGNCPMNLACLKESLVHYATISYSDKHNKSNLNTKEVAKQVLRNAIVITKKLLKHVIKLSTEYWNLKKKQLKQFISCKIKGIYKCYNQTSKHCNLCLPEKLEILDDPDKNLLNKRQELSPSVITKIRIDLNLLQ